MNDFPQLPPGFRWNVRYGDAFRTPRVRVRIKGRILTHAEDQSFFYEDDGPETDLDTLKKVALRAARRAYSSFSVDRAAQAHKYGCSQIQDSLNRGRIH